MKAIITLILTTALNGAVVAQSVLRAPEEIKGLQNRWKWAMTHAEQQGLDKGVWIAYSIDCLMGENSWIGSFHTIPEPSERSLYEIITGRHIENPGHRESDDDVSDRAQRILERDKQKGEDKQVIKELAFLFEFDGKPSDVSSLRTIHPTNVELDVDLKGKPLLWLGKMSAEESIGFLARYFSEMKTSKQKQHIVVAVGVHKQNRDAFAFLRSIVGSNEPEKVREDAVFWIGQQNSREALEFLMGVAKNDGSHRVSKNAVFAISQIRLEEATDALIDLGRSGESRDIRKEAVFWLSQRASKQAVQTLKEFAYEGEDTEVQKQAIFALSQIHDEAAITEIIKIAKGHPNPKVRKQAIFWLGESNDPRAFDAIVEIAKGK